MAYRKTRRSKETLARMQAGKAAARMERPAPEYPAMLPELRTHTGGRAMLFPNLRNPQTYMTATTINRALERMGYAGRFSGHGFRSTASTLLHEMGWRSDVIERQLAHAERDKVKAAYNRAEYLPERRDMMQAWADWIDGLRTQTRP